MDGAAERRVDETLTQIARVAGSGAQFQVLRAGAAHRRDAARAEAEEVAAASGRTALARDARADVRQILDERFTQFHPRVVYGWAADTTTATDRVEILLALQDLVLARAVEDLVPEDTYRTLAEEGRILVAEPRGDVELDPVELEEGGPVDPDASPRAAMIGVAVVAVGLIAILAVLIVWARFGPWAGILGGVLAASILFTIAKPPPHRR